MCIYIYSLLQRIRSGTRVWSPQVAIVWLQSHGSSGPVAHCGKHTQDAETNVLLEATELLLYKSHS